MIHYDTTCPLCGASMTIQTWDEHHPWGSTTAAEPMADIGHQECECELDDDAFELALERAEPQEPDV